MSSRFGFLVVVLFSFLVIVSEGAVDCIPRADAAKSASMKKILENHNAESKDCPSNGFSTVLGYVTPWLVTAQVEKYSELIIWPCLRNSLGYEVAKYKGKRFTVISPVWYEYLSRDGKTIFHGAENVDNGWLEDVRAANPDVEIYPRLSFHPLMIKQVLDIMQKSKKTENFLNTIKNEWERVGYDGIILDMGSFLMYPQNQALLPRFLKQIVPELGFKVSIVIPADPEFLEKAPIIDLVQFISVNLYDFLSDSRSTVRPLAPLPWCKSVISGLLKNTTEANAHKILFGLGMYGNEYDTSGQAKAVTGNDLISKIKKMSARKEFKSQKIHWFSGHSEHVFRFSESEEVYYPTVQSISKRIEIAKSFNTGLSIWEIGQGLDYFYDLI